MPKAGYLKVSHHILLYTLVLTAIGLSFSGCQNSSQYTTPRQPDSAAYGPAHFGMLKSDFFKAVGDTLTTIDNSLFELKPHFSSRGELYELIIQSQDEKYSDYKTTLDTDLKTLIDKMISLYGNPTRYFTLPEPDDFSFFSRARCIWRFPKKNIDISVIQLGSMDGSPYHNNLRFRAICQITNIPMQRVEEEEQLNYFLKNRKK